MTLPLIVDLSVAILLVVTIVYAVALNRRLAGLRKDKAALEVAAASFEKATNRAGTGIAKLKTDSAELHEMMRTAQSLRDDLAFLIERGGSEADRLENVVRDARDHEDAPPPPARPPAELRAERPAAKPRATAKTGGTKTAVTRLAPRSSAERDLLRAIQTARQA